MALVAVKEHYCQRHARQHDAVLEIPAVRVMVQEQGLT